MYGLDADTNISFIANQRLIQVCFGQNDLILHLEESERVSILVTSSIGCTSSTGALHRCADFNEASGFVLSLLGMMTTSVQILSGGTLRLGFENGKHLEIYDDSSEFESYTIEHSGKVIVV